MRRQDPWCCNVFGASKLVHRVQVRCPECHNCIGKGIKVVFNKDDNTLNCKCDCGAEWTHTVESLGQELEA